MMASFYVIQAESVVFQNPNHIAVAPVESAARHTALQSCKSVVFNLNWRRNRLVGSQFLPKIQVLRIRLLIERRRARALDFPHGFDVAADCLLQVKVHHRSGVALHNNVELKCHTIPSVALLKNDVPNLPFPCCVHTTYFNINKDERLMNSFEQIYNQSIGFLLCSTRYSFVLLKGLEPKKVLRWKISLPRTSVNVPCNELSCLLQVYKSLLPAE